MRYHDIKTDDMLNGDGVRAVLFESGCTHQCPGCQNPQTWDKDSGVEFDESAKAALFEYLSQPYVDGITFSGGDPLAPFNRDETLALATEIKERFPDKTVWIYSGYTKDELAAQGFWDKLKGAVDVLVEGRFDLTKRDVGYSWAGSTNQRVLRKESGFAINTSDPVHKAVEEFASVFRRLSSCEPEYAASLALSLEIPYLENKPEMKDALEFALFAPAERLVKDPKDAETLKKAETILEKAIGCAIEKETLSASAIELASGLSSEELEERIDELSERYSVPKENLRAAQALASNHDFVNKTDNEGPEI